MIKSVGCLRYRLAGRFLTKSYKKTSKATALEVLKMTFISDSIKKWKENLISL